MRKTMKISEVIERLQHFQKNLGDVEVYLTNREGILFGTLERQESFWWNDQLTEEGDKQKILTICPATDNILFVDLVETNKVLTKK